MRDIKSNTWVRSVVDVVERVNIFKRRKVDKESAKE